MSNDDDDDNNNNEITAMPLVFSATGVIPNMLNQSLTTLNLPPRLLSQVQKMVVLNTSSIARKFLNVEAHLFGAEVDKP
jgi:hypothetical protein